MSAKKSSFFDALVGSVLLLKTKFEFLSANPKLPKRTCSYNVFVYVAVVVVDNIVVVIVDNYELR